MTYFVLVAKVLCLAATLLPSVAFLCGGMSLDTVKWTMLGGTIGWFIVAISTQFRNGVASQ